MRGAAPRTLLGAAAGIAAVTVLARVVGFGRTAVLAHTVGLECVGGTYVVANAVPNVVFEVVAGGALASLVVPVLAGAVARGDRSAASRTASALLTWTLLVLTPAALLGLLLAPVLVRGLLGDEPACGPAAQQVGTAMLRLFTPQVVLYGVAVVLTGVLQAHRRFLGPALAPLLSSLVVAAAYLLYAWRGAAPLADFSRSQQVVLAGGTTLGVAVLAGSLLVPLRGTGVRLRPTLAFPPGVAGQVRTLSGAGVAGLAAQQLALVVALRLAGESASGAGVFTVATAVFLLPWAVLAVPVATSVFPRLAAVQDDAEYADLARRALRAVLVLTLGGAALLAAVAVPAARLLDPAVAPDLAEAVRAFAPGLVGYGLLALLARALYARGDGRTPAAATVVGWLVVVAADVLLVLGTGLAPATALGLGNAVGMTVAAVLLLAGLHRTAPTALAGTTRTAAAGLVAALLAAGLAVALPEPAQASVAVSLAAGTGLALVVVLTYALVLRLADPAGWAALRRG